ncbi:hypothetical protein CPB83DRAFT_910969 [Crepidotus variabilis]|uniref:Uncharacterized protein n=1 Tax=Crepidotus variabilis TaxID=179855 RepID=A0A9P6JJH2_9AGAR|nr:hypothetical protein CPB83DRAFT_910969 [Crepidotus variabilis]
MQQTTKKTVTKSNTCPANVYVRRCLQQFTAEVPDLQVLKQELNALKAEKLRSQINSTLRMFFDSDLGNKLNGAQPQIIEVDHFIEVQYFVDVVLEVLGEQNRKWENVSMGEVTELSHWVNNPWNLYRISKELNQEKKRYGTLADFIKHDRIKEYLGWKVKNDETVSKAEADRNKLNDDILAKMEEIEELEQQKKDEKMKIEPDQKGDMRGVTNPLFRKWANQDIDEGYTPPTNMNVTNAQGHTVKKLITDFISSMAMKATGQRELRYLVGLKMKQKLTAAGFTF